MANWLKNLPKNVDFIRQPAIFDEHWGNHAKAYFTAEALGVVDKVHSDFFDQVQNKKSKLESENELADFFAAHGVDKDQFHEAYNSFLVDTKMRQAPQLQQRYGITGVPTFIINGKYKTDARTAGSQEKIIEVLDQLIKQESETK